MAEILRQGIMSGFALFGALIGFSVPTIAVIFIGAVIREMHREIKRRRKTK